LDNYEVIFGLCPGCQAIHGLGDPDALIRLRPISDLLGNFRVAAWRGDIAELERLFEEGLNLLVEPTDLLLGALQPLLYDIGNAWARGGVTMATEHRFTSFVETVLERLWLRLHLPKLSGRLDVLLVAAEGNYHTIGLRMVELLLRLNGFSCQAYYPGLPKQEVLALVDKHQPQYLGASLFERGQLHWAQELARELPRHRATTLLLGGWAVRAGHVPRDQKIPAFRNAPEFLSYIRHSRLGKAG